MTTKGDSTSNDHFTQSTAVLHKYLNDKLKILCLLQFFPEVALNSLRIPCVFHVQRNRSVFQVFQVCGHNVTSGEKGVKLKLKDLQTITDF